MAEDDLGKLSPSRRGLELPNPHNVGTDAALDIRLSWGPNLVMPIDDPSYALSVTVFIDPAH
jgi:hypothetical protein